MATINTKNDNYQKRFEFLGDTLPTEWNIIQQGAGQTITVANSVLTIGTGTTANAVTKIRMTRPISLKAIARTIAKLTQRIANQTFQVGITNAAETTYAYFQWSGTTNTVVSAISANGGVANAAANVTTAATTGYGVYDLAAEVEQCFWNYVVANASTRKTGVIMRDQNIPEPGEEYFVQINVINGPTAPASNTNFDIDAIMVEDLTMLGVEILRASGESNPASAMPVYNAGGVIDTLSTCNTVTTVTTAFVAPKTVNYADSSTALAASATFTGVSRDSGATPLYTDMLAFALSNVAGTVQVEQSTDNTNWVLTDSMAVSANTPTKMPASLVARYARVKYINGATAQTSFTLWSTLES
jgi:hypothetical protein